MKQNLNISRHVYVAGAILALAGLTVSSAEKPPIPGKDLLHFAIHERMLNEGAVARASGQLDLHVDTHGNKSHEDLHLHLRGLDPTATYQLGAPLNGDSNVTQVVTFTPDREGNSDIHLREKGPKNPKSKNGHVDAQLPPELQPVTLIDQLLVSDTSGVAVLTADLTAPDHFEYLAKRDLSAGDIQARLDIKSNNHKAQVHLTAKGLEAG